MFSALSESTPFTTVATAILEFDPSKKGEGITLSNGNKMVTYQSSSGSWRSVLGKTKLTADTMSSVTWEITLRVRHKSMAFKIGFLEGDDYAAVQLNNWIGHNTQGCKGAMIYINAGNEKFYNQTAYGSDDFLPDIGRKPKDCKAGDRFEIQFDFVEKRATALYNGKSIGLITDALPTNVYPAVTLLRVYESVETTKFEIT